MEPGVGIENGAYESTYETGADFEVGPGGSEYQGVLTTARTMVLDENEYVASFVGHTSGVLSLSLKW